MTRVRSKIRAPPVRAPRASDAVTSTGLAVPSPGSQMAPTRSSVARTGYSSLARAGVISFALQVVRLGGGRRPPELHHPLLGPGHRDTAAALEPGRQPGLLPRACRRASAEYCTSRVPPSVARNCPTSPAACQVVPAAQPTLLEQHHVGPAQLGQVVGGARSRRCPPPTITTWARLGSSPPSSCSSAHASSAHTAGSLHPG